MCRHFGSLRSCGFAAIAQIGVVVSNIFYTSKPLSHSLKQGFGATTFILN
jgi:hypothetical protein